jgi:hypothetical protein
MPDLSADQVERMSVFSLSPPQTSSVTLGCIPAFQPSPQESSVACHPSLPPGASGLINNNLPHDQVPVGTWLLDGGTGTYIISDLEAQHLLCTSLHISQDLWTVNALPEATHFPMVTTCTRGNARFIDDQATL